MARGRGGKGGGRGGGRGGRGRSQPEPTQESASAEASPEDIEKIVINGRVAALKKVLAANREVALQPGLVPLAANYGEQGCLEILLDHGADIHEVLWPEIGLGRWPCVTAIEHACLRADVGLVKLCLSRGAATPPNLADLLSEAETSHAGDETWARCSADCLEAIAAARRHRARRRLRAAIALVAELLAWQTRAAERAYRPGGAGFREAAAEFEAAAMPAAARAEAGPGGTPAAVEVT